MISYVLVKPHFNTQCPPPPTDFRTFHQHCECDVMEQSCPWVQHFLERRYLLKIIQPVIAICKISFATVHILWEGHENLKKKSNFIWGYLLRNSYLTAFPFSKFLKRWDSFSNFCGLLRISELYCENSWHCISFSFVFSWWSLGQNWKF